MLGADGELGLVLAVEIFLIASRPLLVLHLMVLPDSALSTASVQIIRECGLLGRNRAARGRSAVALALRRRVRRFLEVGGGRDPAPLQLLLGMP